MEFFSKVITIKSSSSVFLVFKIRLRMTKSNQQIMFYNTTSIFHLALYLKTLRMFMRVLLSC